MAQRSSTPMGSFEENTTFSLPVGAGAHGAQTCLPNSLNSRGCIQSVFTVRPIVTFLSALVNTQHSCRSASSKASRNTKIPFHFPPKSYLTVWGSTFKNTRINSGLTQARTTHDDKEICNYNQRVNQAYLMFDRGRPVWIHIWEESNLKHHRKKKRKEINHN